MSDSPGGFTASRFWRVARWFVAGIPATLFAVILFAAQVGKDDATKNIKSYLDWLLPAWPEWLTARLIVLFFGALAVIVPAVVFRSALRSLLPRIRGAYRVLRGRSPAPPAPPSQQEIVAMNDVDAAFQNAANAAAVQILSLCMNVQNDKRGQGVTLAWLLEDAKTVLRDRKSGLEAALGDRTGSGIQRVRAAFIDFLAAYGTVVRAVHDFEREGVDLLHKDYAYSYHEWEKHHLDLLKRLHDMKVQKPLAPIGQLLEGEKRLRSSDGLRYSSLYARAMKLFQSAKPDQLAFLRLFCTDVNPTQEKPIEGRIYHAGVGLADEKILKLDDGDDGARWFSLPVPVREAWVFGGPPHLMRDRVLIHPNSVVYPTDPGGGTGGSFYPSGHGPTRR